MKLQQIIRDKFSIVLMMAIAFIALPVVTAAQTLFKESLAGEGKKVTIAFCKTDKTDLNRVHISRLSLLTGTFDGGVGVVDSFDPDAASKIKMLFDVRRDLRLTNDVVIEIPEDNTTEWFEAMNYLRWAQASGSRIPAMELSVTDSDQQLSVELKDVYITSYQTSGGGDRPTASLSINFSAIKFEYKPQKEDG